MTVPLSRSTSATAIATKRPGVAHRLAAYVQPASRWSRPDVAERTLTPSAAGQVAGARGNGATSRRWPIGFVVARGLPRAPRPTCRSLASRGLPSGRQCPPAQDARGWNAGIKRNEDRMPRRGRGGDRRPEPGGHGRRRHHRSPWSSPARALPARALSAVGGDLAVDSEGNVWVEDATENRRQVRLQRLLRRGPRSPRGWRRRSPTNGLGADDRGGVYVNDDGSRVVKWTRGRHVRTYGAGALTSASDVAGGQDGVVHVVEAGRIAPGRTAPPSDVTRPPPSTGATSPSPSGELYLNTTSRIVRLRRPAPRSTASRSSRRRGARRRDDPRRQPASTGRPLSRAWFRSTPRT